MMATASPSAMFSMPGDGDALDQIGQPGAQADGRGGRSEEAHQRDADLNRRQEAAGIIGQVEQHLRRLVAVFDQLFQAQLGDADHRNLRRGEKSVERDQHGEEQKFGNDWIHVAK